MSWMRGAAQKPRFGDYNGHQSKKPAGDVAKRRTRRKRLLRVYRWVTDLHLNDRERRLIAAEIFS